MSNVYRNSTCYKPGGTSVKPREVYFDYSHPVVLLLSCNKIQGQSHRTSQYVSNC